MCDICGERPGEVWDHEHEKTKYYGNIRGRLCKRCNQQLPMVENPRLLAAALAYVQNPPMFAHCEVGHRWLWKHYLRWRPGRQVYKSGKLA